MPVLHEFKSIICREDKKLRGRGSTANVTSDGDFRYYEQGTQWATVNDKGNGERPSYAMGIMEIIAEFPPPPIDSRLFWMSKVRIASRLSSDSAEDESLDVLLVAAEMPRENGEGYRIIGPHGSRWEAESIGIGMDTTADGNPDGIFWINGYERIPALVNRDNVGSSEAFILMGGMTEVPVLAGTKPIVIFGTATILGAFDGEADMGVGLSVFNGIANITSTTNPGLAIEQKGVFYTYFASGGGGCFITEAVCHALGKSDNCQELALLRIFRDTYVRSRPDGYELIAEYYENAPRLIERISACPEASELLAEIYSWHLRPCINKITMGRNEEAVALYRHMYDWLLRKFG